MERTSREGRFPDLHAFVQTAVVDHHDSYPSRQTPSGKTMDEATTVHDWFMTD